MGVFDGSIGAFVVGTIISTFLLGITTCQVYEYLNNFPNDRRLYWWLVVSLCVMDWTHSAVSVYTIWDWCVENYGQVEHLLVSPFSFAVDPAMTGVVAFVTQIFYAYRVYIVGKRSIAIPIVIAFLSTVSLAFAIASTAKIFILQEFAKFQSFTYGVSIWLACAALADIIITASLVFHLAKSKTGLLQTNSILNRIIELVISTNGLTSSAALIDAVLFGALTSSWHVAPNLCLVKLYFNSLLVSLNARADLERRLANSSQHADSHQLNDLTRSTGGGPGQTKSVRTALGFGPEDCDPTVVYPARDLARRAPGGIRVTTHQSVIDDSGLSSSTYLPPDTEKDLPFYSTSTSTTSRDKEDEARRDRSAMPVTHFADDVERGSPFGGKTSGSV
ncbi:hypothetical protein JCM10212_004029 [Sporobolomyces blumeae]